MTSLPVTSLVAGVMAALMVMLSLSVSLRRRSTSTSFGDGDDRTLRRRIRAHGNFAENAPLALIVLGLVEYGGAASWLVWALGAGFLFSRVVHAAGMLTTSSPAPRAVGMVVTHTCFAIAGIWLVVHAI
jgi:uncharacterized membrane protein YecN with MAPEG domain